MTTKTKIFIVIALFYLLTKPAKPAEQQRQDDPGQQPPPDPGVPPQPPPHWSTFNQLAPSGQVAQQKQRDPNDPNDHTGQHEVVTNRNPVTGAVLGSIWIDD